MTAWLLGLALAALSAPHEQVSFLVMGKTTNHRQMESGEAKLLNYHFFAEIFVREGSHLRGAALRFPHGDVQEFEDLGSVLELHGGRYQEEGALDREYPDGEYAFRFETPDGPFERRVSMSAGKGSRIPPPPRIALLQEGRPVSVVDPERDLIVTWSEFASGRSDPNGILDDLIFVVMGDCRGERTVHSGRPFEQRPFLTYSAKEYRIPKERLAAGQPHQLFVEHAIVDTSKDDEIVGLVTYASTTFLDFRTSGSARGEPCPEVMPGMDPGQTDREERR